MNTSSDRLNGAALPRQSRPAFGRLIYHHRGHGECRERSEPRSEQVSTFFGSNSVISATFAVNIPNQRVLGSARRWRVGLKAWAVASRPLQRQRRRNELFRIDNQFSIRAMFDKWAESDVAVTLSSGSSAIIRPDMFILKRRMAN